MCRGGLISVVSMFPIDVFLPIPRWTVSSLHLANQIWNTKLLHTGCSSLTWVQVIRSNCFLFTVIVKWGFTMKSQIKSSVGVLVWHHAYTPWHLKIRVHTNLVTKSSVSLAKSTRPPVGLTKSPIPDLGQFSSADPLHPPSEGLHKIESLHVYICLQLFTMLYLSQAVWLLQSLLQINSVGIRFQRINLTAKGVNTSSMWTHVR